MEVIKSFTIDHTCLKPGIYVSRRDKGFTTFDIRITEPNKEPAMTPAAIHSIEHLMATWFRNSSIKNQIVYVGPMGCLTGMYLIVTTEPKLLEPEDIADLMEDFIYWTSTQTQIPGVGPKSCGNYLLHDFPMARWYLGRFLDLLKFGKWESNHRW